MIAKLGIGVVGLGRAFSLTAPALVADPRVRLTAGADARPEMREKFKREFGLQAYADIDALLGSPGIDVVYIATPHAAHAAQAIAAAQRGKHVLVEKPMALSAQQCAAMIEAARKSGVVLMVGPSHSFDPPILRARKLIQSFGKVRMISALNFTDFAVRRRRDAADTALHNQAPHQVEIVRLLAGCRVVSVKASASAGAYTCTLGFESGVSAALTYSGYGRFRSDELMGGTGELGKPGVAHPHFGVFIVSCEKADLRPMPTGVMIYGDGEPRLDALPAPDVPRREVIDELYAAIVEKKPPLHSGEWAAATMDVCFAMQRSASEQREILL